MSAQMMTLQSLLRYLADLGQQGGTLTLLAAMVLGVLTYWLVGRRETVGARRPARRDLVRHSNRRAPRNRPPRSRRRGGRS
jgi:hypothetical protein